MEETNAVLDTNIRVLTDELDQQQKHPKSKKNNPASRLAGWSPAAQPSQPISDEMAALDLTDSSLSSKQQRKREFLKNNKKPINNSGSSNSKPKLTKKERREIQEKQRLAKNLSKDGGSVTKKKENSALPTAAAAAKGIPLQYDDPKRVARRSKTSLVERRQATKTVALFSHLPQYVSGSLTSKIGFSAKSEIHPCILSLGLKYAHGEITGSNARCVAMLVAFQTVIKDYNPPKLKEFRRDLIHALGPAIQFLIDCRPHSVSMGNAIRYMKNMIGQISTELSEKDAKTEITDNIETYIQERIVLALEGIKSYAVSKIENGDVLLTYARSCTVESVILEAKQRQKDFRVIVVDSRPLFEGQHLVKILTEAGIHTTYVTINSLAYIMRDVTKVFLGASAFLSNGAALSRVGTATVAMTAHAFNIPVLFCCETFKFSSRVQLDSITQNELRNVDELLTPTLNSLSSENSSKLKLVNLVYDVTPMNYVTMVVTEVGMTPPTSIPVLVRESHKMMS